MPSFLLNVLPYLLIILAVPTVVIIRYLLSHYRDVNGDIGKMRKILIAVLSSSLLLMLVEIYVLFSVIYGWRLFYLDRLLFLSIAAVIMGAVNWWALFKTRKLREG